MPVPLLDRWWKPKATNLLAIVYGVALLAGLPFERLLALLVPAVLTIAGIGTFGHLVNDWYDAGADRRVGKPNRLEGLPTRRRLALVAASVAIALLPWTILPRDAWSIVLLALEFALLLAYAVPPLRLKQRPVPAVLADGLYAYAVPAVLAAHTFLLAAGRQADLRAIAALFVWQLALGARHFLNHVALDRQNDLETGTRTLATVRGNRFIHRLVRRVILPVEIAGFAVLVIGVFDVHRLLPVTLVAIAIVLAGVHFVVTVGRRYPLAPYRFSRTTLDRFYQSALPIVILGYLTARDWRFGLLVLVQALLFSPAIRRAFGGLSDAWRAMAAPASGFVGAPLPLDSHADVERPEGALTPIAVANINKGKYTETFITEALPRLPFAVHYLHGGELPQFDPLDRHFLSNWPSIQALARLFESMARLEPGYLLRTSIGGYLQSRGVRLVLAHFGPVGACMLPVTRDLGIPLVVWFHGYDAFHGPTVRQWAAAYGALFREADRIIGVSEVMLDRLEQMGAPRSKLVHLPAFVNLERFPYSDRSAAGPHFLAVGRFADTKSPHLTILAFARMAQSCPGATLTMVGKGGGGELFEACLTLVRALRLDGQVTLTGVLSHDEVAAEMRRARVFVQHSVTTPEHGDMEGKPVAVMEAMASGLPVVATRHSGIAELIEDGVTGFLVPEFDIEAMAGAMLRLAGDEDLVREVGRRASARIHEDPLVRDHVRILERLIEESMSDTC